MPPVNPQAVPSGATASPLSTAEIGANHVLSRRVFSNNPAGALAVRCGHVRCNAMHEEEWFQAGLRTQASAASASASSGASTASSSSAPPLDGQGAVSELRTEVDGDGDWWNADVRGASAAVASPSSSALSALRARIDEIFGLIHGEQFQEAADALMDVTCLQNLGVARSLVLSDKSPKDLANRHIENGANDNMYSPMHGGMVRIFLPNPPGRQAPPDWLGNPLASRQVLLMGLEEFMHVYQKMAKTYISPRTAQFRLTPQATQGVATQGEEYDFDEVDVMAAYQDWGVDVEAVEYVDKYSARQDFFKWQAARLI